jgi:hypothetical protein
MTASPLPGFDELWVRGAALAVAFRAAGFDDVWWRDDDGLHHDDGGGNTARLVALPGGRGVAFGHDHEYSATTFADPPIDLLADGPAWLPWDLLVAPAEADELGFCRWWDGTSWTDGNPAGRGVDDELAAVLSGVAGDDAAAAGALVEVVTTWHEASPSPEEVVGIEAAAAELLRAARTGSVTAPLLAELFRVAPAERSDTNAAMRIAAACGIADGAPRPARTGRPGPATRRVRRLSPDAHDEILHDAMAREPERERPAVTVGPQPVPGRLARAHGRGPWSAAERALLDHVRSRRAPGADRGVLVALVADSWATSTDDAEHPLDPADARAVFTDMERAQALRDADRDDAHGTWFFVRVEVGPDAERIDRAFDGIPAWWTADRGRRGPSRDLLRVEVGRRAPEWRPSWASLIDAEGVAFEDVPVPREG